jgi:hypothetical protein
MRTSLSASPSELLFGRSVAKKYVSFVVAQMSFVCAAGCCTTDDLPTKDGPITRSGSTTFDGTTDNRTEHNRLVFSCPILLDLLWNMRRQVWHWDLTLHALCVTCLSILSCLYYKGTVWCLLISLAPSCNCAISRATCYEDECDRDNVSPLHIVIRRNYFTGIRGPSCKYGCRDMRRKVHQSGSVYR